jgi:signal transduction histidine kinase
VVTVAMTLRLKLFVLIAAVIIFAMSGVTAVALWREVQRGQELLRREGSALASTAAAEASRWVGPDGVAPGGDAALQAVLEGLTRSGQLERAWVVTHTGKVCACRSLTGAGCPDGPPPSEFRDVDLPMQALMRLVRPEGIVSSAPILREGQVVGAVLVDFTHEEVVGNARELAWGASVVAFFWIVLGHVLTAIFIRQVTRPLVRLSQAAEHLAEERGVRLDPPEDKELSDLVRAFNHMSARLEERRAENQRLIAELEERVAQKTREVLRADRLATLGGIAAGFAHEIGNSLNVIRGFSSVAAREVAADSPVKEDVEAIRREVGRAASLIERFLVFARARSAHPHPQPIEPIVREAAEVVGPAAAQAKVERTVELDADLPLVDADAELLRQAFLNLCVNAIQAMQEQGGGRLAVRARRDGAGVVVEVSDSGRGIAPDARAHIFEPFFTTKATGTGLGLAIVRQAAEAHGGAVEVDDAPGGGATFRVRLPGVAADAGAADGDAGAAGGGAGDDVAGGMAGARKAGGDA